MSTNNPTLVVAQIEALQRRSSLQIPSDAILEAASANARTLASVPSIP